MTPPPHAVLLTREKSVKHAFERAVLIVREKLRDFFWRWWKSNQIETRATKQRDSIRFKRWCELLRFNRCEDESINTIAAPRFIANRWRWRCRKRSIRPPTLA